MMHGHEKSDPEIVAIRTNVGGIHREKPANNAAPAAAESVERRAGTKGNAGQSSTRRTQSRISVSQGVGSHTAACCRHYPRWEPYAGKPTGGEVTRVPKTPVCPWWGGGPVCVRR